VIVGSIAQDSGQREPSGPPGYDGAATSQSE
jgi:hypothetical protein